MNKKLLIGAGIVGMLIIAAGNTHRILPAESDECQQDISHMAHISDLPMFHCIAHKEYVVNPDGDGRASVARWFHLHPWMTLEWHIEQGFAPEHAAELISHHE